MKTSTSAKPKFSFSAKVKKEQQLKDSETFNIDELQKYYLDFTNNYKSINYLQ